MAKIENYQNDTPVVTLDNPKKEFDYANSEVILRVKHLKQYFRFGKGKFKYTKAVHDISFDVYKGEVFGLVGESGCGKTTTGRSIIKLYKITSGDVWFKGVRIAAGTRWNEKEIKFTKIRLNQKLKELKAEQKAEIEILQSELLAKHSDLAGKINAKFAALIAEKEELIASIKDEGEDSTQLRDSTRTQADCLRQDQKSELKELKYKIKEEYASGVEKIKANFKQFAQKAIDDATVIIRRERINIRKAHHDDAYCDKDIAQKEVNKVKEAYSHLFKPTNLVAEAKLHKDSEESKKILAEYEQYKHDLKEAKRSSVTRKMQMIFQDPIASLNPRMTVRNIIAEGLVIKGIRDKEFISKEVNRVLELVGLLPEHANRYPHEFSGGQRQRIGIARAIIMNPELIIADEPVSALDVSIQAQVINLLNDLRNNLGLTILFIAHNLSVVKYFCDRIAVMYYGSIMEVATSEELFKNPLHPYTKSLLSAVPRPDPNLEQGRVRITYNPVKDHDYSKQAPTLREIAPGHFVRCNDVEMEKYLKELKGE